MIFDELHTILPFYDSIEKQNRNRANCASLCDYALIFPQDTILQFIIAVNKDGPITVNSWYIQCVDDDGLAVDLSSHIAGFIATEVSLADNNYIYFLGDVLPGFKLKCGTYYMSINYDDASTNNTYYSEVFKVIAIADPVFVQDDPPTFSLWKFRQEEDLLNHNLRHCQEVCDYTLLCGNDALLPFQFRIPTGGGMYVNDWRIISDDGSCEYILQNEYVENGNDLLHVNIYTIGDYDYVCYNADAEFSSALPCGVFSAQITIDGVTYYSDKIKIISDVDTVSDRYLLQENSYIILQENNYGILLE